MRAYITSKYITKLIISVSCFTFLVAGTAFFLSSSKTQADSFCRIPGDIPYFTVSQTTFSTSIKVDVDQNNSGETLNYFIEIYSGSTKVKNYSGTMLNGENLDPITFDLDSDGDYTVKVYYKDVLDCSSSAPDRNITISASGSSGPTTYPKVAVTTANQADPGESFTVNVTNPSDTATYLVDIYLSDGHGNFVLRINHNKLSQSQTREFNVETNSSTIEGKHTIKVKAYEEITGQDVSSSPNIFSVCVGTCGPGAAEETIIGNNEESETENQGAVTSFMPFMSIKTLLKNGKDPTTLTLNDLCCDSNDILPSILKLALDLLGLVAFIMLIYASITYLISYGDENKATIAKKTLTWSIVGVCVVVFAESIVYIVYNIFK